MYKTCTFSGDLERLTVQFRRGVTPLIVVEIGLGVSVTGVVLAYVIQYVENRRDLQTEKDKKTKNSATRSRILFG